MNPPEDMNQLLNHAVTAAGEMIALQGGFYAFGAGLKAASEEMVAIMAQADVGEDEENLDPGEVRDALHSALAEAVEAGTYRAVCAVSDGVVVDDDESQVDAVIIRMEHQEHEPLLLVLPYFKERGEWAFGELSRAPYDELHFFKAPA